MTRAISPKATRDFVRPCDEGLPDGHPEKPVFRLRNLTVDQEEELANTMLAGAMGSTELAVKSGSYQRAILDMGLEGWTNLNEIIDDSAEDPAEWEKRPIEFTRTRATNGRIPSKLLDFLGAEARTDIANAITEGAKVTPTAGND